MSESALLAHGHACSSQQIHALQHIRCEKQNITLIKSTSAVIPRLKSNYMRTSSAVSSPLQPSFGQKMSPSTVRGPMGHLGISFPNKDIVCESANLSLTKAVKIEQVSTQRMDSEMFLCTAWDSLGLYVDVGSVIKWKSIEPVHKMIAIANKGESHKDVLYNSPWRDYLAQEPSVDEDEQPCTCPPYAAFRSFRLHINQLRMANEKASNQLKQNANAIQLINQSFEL